MNTIVGKTASLLFTAAVLAAPAVAQAQPASEPAFANPLVRQRADPHVFLHSDGWYYYTATVPEYDRIELRRARSLPELAEARAKVVWRRHASGPMSWHVWAPEIHFVDGRWYVYFTAGRAESIWDIRLYVLECASPDPLAGEWLERGQLRTGWESFTLDATTFVMGGVRYLAWAQKDPKIEGNTNLYLAKMDSPTSIVLPAVRLSQPDLPWEQVKYWVNEAPAVIVHGGRVFMTYSASATDAHYCMGLLTAPATADLLDPRSWTKSPQPVFRTSDANGQFGPGHNSFTTTPDGRTDVLVYHARNYREISGDPLRDPNRHTRAQVLRWKQDGTPDFGEPVADAPKSASIAVQPLFRDPVFDGAADPVVIWNAERRRWWMFYTNRRANVPGLGGVTWVHGTPIGIAESNDGGASWTYLGTAEISLPAEIAGGEPTTLWAPDVVTAPDGSHHMFLSVVPGVFEDWQHPRRLVHLVSRDLRRWTDARVVPLASDRVIDASLFRRADGGWRLFYNDERDHKSIHFADSPDLLAWTERGRAVGDQAGEGPKVFRWHGAYWMITDVWRGLAIYRSDDASTWVRQGGGNLLEQPGAGPDDGVKGGHADVVVNGDRAYLFYFTHPGRRGAAAEADGYEQRRSSIQVVELRYANGRLECDRDAPTRIRLAAPQEAAH